MPSGLSLPAWTKLIAEDSVTNMTCVSPPSIPVTAGPAPPLYGMCTILRSANFMNRSISKRFNVLDPGDAKLSSPGFDFANATSSATVFAGTLGLAIRMLGTPATSVIAVKSFCGLIDRLGNTAGLIAIVPMLPR